jgi:hypothetical protein
VEAGCRTGVWRRWLWRVRPWWDVEMLRTLSICRTSLPLDLEIELELDGLRWCFSCVSVLLRSAGSSLVGDIVVRTECTVGKKVTSLVAHG